MNNFTVIDSGLWVELACRLARAGKPVNYYSAWEGAFVSVRDPSPGYGLEDEGVARIDAPFRNDRDRTFVFPWLHQEWMAQLAEEHDVPVFGCVSEPATGLERDRLLLCGLLAEAQQPLARAQLVKGCAELSTWLGAFPDFEKFIKLSNFRGDFETYNHTDVQNSQLKIAEWRKRFGPYADAMLFHVEDPIEAEVEVGVDTFFAGGHFLSPAIGYERKDKLYAGRVIDTRNLSKGVVKLLDATDVLTGYLRSIDYRNWFTNEMRVTKDGEVYMTDVTTRCPIPPGAAMMENVANLSAIIEQGAKGKSMPVAWEHDYMVEVIVSSPALKEDWLEVRFPKEFRHFVKMRNFSKVDGRYWIAPHPTGMTEMISCVGFGDTLTDALDHGRAVAEAVCKKTYQATFDARAFDDLDRTIEKGVKLGIEF